MIFGEEIFLIHGLKSLHLAIRSLREGLPAVPRQENKEEEDHGEEEYSLSRLQRGACLRCSRGQCRGCQSYSKSNRLRQVKKYFWSTETPNTESGSSVFNKFNVLHMLGLDRTS